MRAEEPALYLYGLVATSMPVPAIGDGSKVFAFGYDDVACIASAIGADDSTVLTHATRSQRREWVAEHVWRHHHVLQRIHAAGPVVPLKAGTISTSLDRLRNILACNRESIATALRRFRGKDEWTLAVYTDSVASRSVEKSHTMRSDVVTRARSGSPARRYFARVWPTEPARPTTPLPDATMYELATKLGALGVGLTDAALGPAESRPQIRPIGSIALLVSRDLLSIVRNALAEFEHRHQTIGLTTRLSGPYPPYAFAGHLDLNDSGGLQRRAREIRTALRRVGSSWIPSKHPTSC